MKSAFIVGVGYVGSALASRLCESGWQVAGLDRREVRFAGANLKVVDLRQPDALDLEAACGAVVYYLVPTLHRNYDPKAQPHLRPMQRLLAGLERQRITKLIYVSSTSVYGDRGGDWVDEGTPPGPDSPWGQMRLELEQLAWRFGAEAQVPAIVVRLPEIYGPSRGPVQRLREGHVPHHLERWTNRIHLDDLVQVLGGLAEREAPRLLLCSDNEPAPAQEVYSLAARLLELPDLPISRFDLRLDRNRQALGRSSKRCRNALLRCWLGRPLRYPSFREGLPATL